MAANDFIQATIPMPGDIACKNTEASTDLAAGDVVKLDTSNVVSGTQGTFGVLQGTAAAQPIGVAIEAITHGKIGRVRPLGAVVWCVASASTAAGLILAASSSGKVAAQTSGQTQLGLSLTAAAADGDRILVMLFGGKNA